MDPYKTPSCERCGAIGPFNPCTKCEARVRAESPEEPEWDEIPLRFEQEMWWKMGFAAGIQEAQQILHQEREKLDA